MSELNRWVAFVFVHDRKMSHDELYDEEVPAVLGGCEYIDGPFYVSRVGGFIW